MGQTFDMHRKWEGRAILLVDLDAFFASVEQLDHPEWRGKPVIVGGPASRRGVVSTASYEARAFGVHSAMPSAAAERLCPQAIWTSSHFERYHEVSAQVMQILRDESPLVEQMSIDEAFLDASPGRFCGDDPVKIAARIQNRVAELGVTCSIGVGTGKAVAKIASDLDKPRGLSVVYPGGEAAFLAPMDVRAMPGIGARTAEKLHIRGIKTLGDLAQADPALLKPVFGVNARAFCRRAAGIDEREVVAADELKSVSHERTFTHDLTTRAQIEDAIDLLGSMVGRRARRNQVAGRTVVVKLRYDDLSSRTAQTTLHAYTDDESVFIPPAKELVGQLWRPGERVRLVGVGLSSFERGDVQLGLFDMGPDADGERRGADGQAGAGNTASENRGTGARAGSYADAGGGTSGAGKTTGRKATRKTARQALDAADAVRDKFGESAVKFGREMKLSVRDTGTRGQNEGTVQKRNT